MKQRSRSCSNQKRRILFIVSLIFLLSLFYKFYSIQIIQFNKYKLRSLNNSIRKIINKAPRGIIYDRNNSPIVDNQPTYDLSAIPFDVNENFNYELFAELTGLDANEVSELISTEKKKFNRFKLQTLKRHVAFEERSRIEEYKLEFPGIRFVDFPARTYPNSAKLTHVLGYLRSVTQQVLDNQNDNKGYQLGDVFGYSGLEKIYENTLRGTDGVEFHLVDIYGIDHGIFEFEHNYPILSGDSLTLSIDTKIQLYTEELMEGLKGAIIALDPLTGEIYSYVSAPDYDLKSFVGPIPLSLWDEWNNSDNKPLMNRVIRGTYPPGSIFKLIMAAIALDNGIISKHWSAKCNGSYLYGGRVFHCWNKAGHGKVDLTESIKHSCNIYYYQLIQKISFDDWSTSVSDFGFGKPTQIDLPGERSGIVPTKKFMNDRYTSRGWGKGSLLNFVIGQGDILVTPIQIIQLMNLIATNGQTYQPKLNMNVKSTPINLTLKPSTWKFIQQAMREVVNGDSGTGKNARISDGIVRGKTGTSQNPHGEDHSWFAGYVTLDNGQKLSISVIVENGGKGSGISAGIARQIFQFYSDLKSDGKNI